MGPVLREGERFTLEIAAGMKSARGRSVSATHAKSFDVGPADYEQPDLARWSIDGGVVEVDEWLDRAGLEEFVTVDGKTGRVDGRRIAFDLAAGEHELVVDPRLEDLCGNSFSRPFESASGAARGDRALVRKFASR
jgi:hypothetical protein